MPEVTEQNDVQEIQSNLSQSSATADNESSSENASTSKRFKRSTDQEDAEDEMFSINPVLVAQELLKTMQSLYPEYTDIDTGSNGKEAMIASQLYNKFVHIVASSVFVEDNLNEQDEEHENAINDAVDWVDGDGTLKSNVQMEKQYGTIELSEKIKIMAMVDKHPSWSLKTLHKHGCAALKHLSYKQRWRSDIAEGGTRFDKLKLIDSFVYTKFLEARKVFRPIHDDDLRGWAMLKARTFPHSPGFSFEACRSWVLCFKNRHGITSRKVTKLVSKKEITEQDELNRRANSFRERIRDALKSYSPEYVINSDQTGCNYELTSNRTLSFLGEKSTLMFARSPKNKATHSYTVQFTISASGRLIGPAFLCLQEKTGKMGSRVKENLFQAKNVVVTCTSSGKMTSSIVEYYLDKCILPWAKSHNQNFIFTFDNYSGQTKQEFYSSRFTGTDNAPTCEVIHVPAKCTSMCQPLDTTFNRQFKFFLRKIEEYASLHATDEGREPMYSRNNIIRRLSLIYYQIGSPKLQPMVKYSWYSAGILEEKEEFLNVCEACFSFKRKGNIFCQLYECQESAFIQCALCDKCVCFKCWFWKYHAPGSGCTADDEDSN